MPVLHPKFLQCFRICTHPCNLGTDIGGLGGPQQREQNQKAKPTLGVTTMLLVSQSVGL